MSHEMHDQEHRLATLLRESTAELTPDVVGLVEGGTARGQGLRRRRRVGTALAAVAVVGVIGVAASVGPGLLDDGSSQGTEGQVTDPGKPDPVKPPQKETPPPTRKLAVKADRIPAIVAELYPGEIAPASARTGRIIDDGPTAQIAHFRWNGFLTSVGAMTGGSTATEACGNLSPGSTCTQLPDGSTLLRWSETGPAVDGAVSGQGASLFTDDGWEVFAISYNAADGKDSPVLADDPPLTLAQLEQIVRDDAWFG